MHSMSDGATSVRERRLLRTADDLSTAARALAVELGLAGFTVEQVCDAAGVSRRTFFNYFASKEDAVLGRCLRRRDEQAVLAFLDRGPRPDALLDDLVALHAARWETLGITRATAAQVRAVLDREPRVLARLLEIAQEDEQADVVLVTHREGLVHDDVRALTAVQLVGTLARASAFQYLESKPDDALTTTFADVLADRLAVARALLGS